MKDQITGIYNITRETFKYLSTPAFPHGTADKHQGDEQESGEDLWDLIQNYMGPLVENN